MNENSCAFTGHRPHKLPWKDNEDDPRCIALKKALTEQITALAEAGITDFFSGMAAGTDHYCAQIVLALREKNPALKLHCVLPHEGQADALRKAAGKAHIPIGEVADRYVLNVAPDDPKNAIILALEHDLICVSRLSKEGSAQVFGDMCGIFLGSIPPEELDEMVSEIKSLRNWEHPAIEPGYRRSAD